MERNPSRGLDRLLRLHRLRSRLDRRPGSQGPGQGHAVRDHRLARRLHGHLHPGVDRDDPDRALHVAERAGPGRGRGRRLRPAMGVVRQDHQGRRDHRPDLGHPGADVRPDPDLLHDGPRRPAAEVLRKVHPKFRTPWINTLVVGLLVAMRGRLLRHQLPRRRDLGRNACRVRHRLPDGDLAAPHPSGNSARLSRCRSIRSFRRSASSAASR